MVQKAALKQSKRELLGSEDEDNIDADDDDDDDDDEGGEDNHDGEDEVGEGEVRFLRKNQNQLSEAFRLSNRKYESYLLFSTAHHVSHEAIL